MITEHEEEAGRHDSGTDESEADRPTGVSTLRDHAGVDPRRVIPEGTAGMTTDRKRHPRADCAKRRFLGGRRFLPIFSSPFLANRVTLVVS
jgi:hypothetical protein